MALKLRSLVGASVLGAAFVWSGCTFDVSGLGPLPESAPNSYQCACTCQNPDRSLDVQISQSTDDAEELVDTTAVYLDPATTDMSQNVSGTILDGLRFSSVGIPAGATLQSAQLQFTAAANSTGAASLSIQGQAAGNPPTFVFAFANLSSRPRTAASVPWAPGAWTAGSTQLSADVRPILQELIARPDWAPGNAVVFFVTGTGERSAWAYDGNPGLAPHLLVTYREPSLSTHLSVCMPDALNPNKNGGTTPSDADLQADCAGRVQTTFDDLSQACSYPSNCSCTFTAGSTALADACNQTCAEQPLAAGCTNFDPTAGNVTATNVPGDAPVCTTGSPLAAEIYGRRSTCQLEGQATLATSDETKSPGAHGSVDLVGTPCPGQSCPVGMSYRFNFDDVTYSSLFSSATFSKLKALGETLPGDFATLDPTGHGLLAPNSTTSTGRGERDNGDVLGLLASNSDALDVFVDWTPGAASCSLNGALVGTLNPEEKRCENAGPHANQLCHADADCGTDSHCSGASGQCLCQPIPSSDMTLSIAVAGPIVNQPPSVSAGPNQTVECNQPNAAKLTLMGKATDPDGNLASFVWLRGSRTGAQIGFQPQISTVQALGTTVPYFFRGTDAFAQADESATSVTVVDTTPPTISCNTPASITPPQAPISFTATAQDVCDPSPSVAIVNYTCFKFTKKGERVDKTGSCGVVINGATITITDSGGVGDHIKWGVQATDQSGNVTTMSCGFVVARP